MGAVKLKGLHDKKVAPYLMWNYYKNLIYEICYM